MKFARAIFLGWYCKKADCKFCYMSTIKAKKTAVRKVSSILAEILLCKELKWDIEFLSAGYGVYPFRKLYDLIKKAYTLYGNKLWLNVGILNKTQLKKLKPYIKGVSGSIECINEKLHDELCPSKPLSEIEEMFKICNGLKLKKSITIIIGLGENLRDVKKLISFIKKHKINRIVFYALKPQKGTIFKKGPNKNYYSKWIEETRKNFPRLKIIVGSWLDRLDELKKLKKYSNYVTKFPAIKRFNSKYAKKLQKITRTNFTRLPKINWDKKVDELKLENDLKLEIKLKLKQYLKVMRKSKK